MRLTKQRLVNMTEFIFSKEKRHQEVEDLAQRDLNLDRLFVLLLGPSATGKSTVIRHLIERVSDPAFEYVKPMMTRPNRPKETDKLSISKAEFEAMQRQRQFVTTNDLYGVQYGTPLRGILEPLGQGRVPILDYPLATVGALKRPEYDLLNFYIYPESTGSWTNRVIECGRNSGGRVESGTEELGSLATAGFVHPDIDIHMVNPDGKSAQTAREILEIVQAVT